MKLSTRELATLAVFGALWGLVEISLGSVLKTLDIPMSGAVLGAIGLSIALAGRVFVPHRGSTLFIGVIAMLLKLFSLGGVVIGPMIGIFTEALVAEVALSLTGAPKRGTLCLAGALGVAWTLAQPFVTGPLLFGLALLDVWAELLQRGEKLLGLAPSAALWIVLGLLAIYLLIGAMAGWLAWDIAQLLQKRLGRSSPDIQGNPQKEKITKWITFVVLAVCAVLLVAIISSAFSASDEPAADTGPSLLVSGGDISRAYTRTDLETLPASQAGFKEVSYVGVTLRALLQDAGFAPDEVSGVTAIASDGYTVPYDPALILAADTIVAYARIDGELAEDEAPFRMVLPGAEGSLNIRMLVALQVSP